MIVLHILDHSLPALSGYSTRSRNIIIFHARLGVACAERLRTPLCPGAGESR